MSSSLKPASGGSAALRAANAMLRRLGVQVVRTGLGIGPRRIRTSMEVFNACRGTITSGPFAGTRLSDQFLWGDANIGAIVLGCYEQQLHPAIEELIDHSPDLVVNIGSAEGTYAVGLARRLPDARVVAVDVEPEAEAAVMANAGLNSVEDRVEFVLDMTTPQLDSILASAKRPAIVIDCEGCELVFLDPEAVPSLAATDILVEVHSHLLPGARETLLSRLAPTHLITEIIESGRDPHAYPQLRSMSSIDKWLLVCEGRDETMCWLWCCPKPSAPTTPP